jgi:hypothetical protein
MKAIIIRNRAGHPPDARNRAHTQVHDGWGQGAARAILDSAFAEPR